MSTLRLLLWLRLKLFLRSTTRSGMIVGALVNALLLLAFLPVWLGGAFAAWTGVRRYGVLAIPAAFAVCQLAWIGLGILSGALGRTFDLGPLLRYPVRPRLVFGVNVVASLVSPVPLMALPTLVALAAGAYARGGALAALGVAAGGAALMLVTGTLLQVLLALLDEVLRHERVRFVATAFITLFFVSLQLLARASLGDLVQRVAVRVVRHEIGPEQALELANRLVGAIPTVAAPAALARGALAGAPVTFAFGLLASIALLAAGVLPGAALMRRTVRGGSSAGSGGTGAGASRQGGTFAMGAPLLPRGVGLLFAREVRMTLRHPQRLLSLIVAPFVGIVFLVTARGDATAGAGFALALLASSVGTHCLVLFGYDGPGVRSYFLLPCAPRDVLLAKHIELLARFAVQLAMAYAALVIVTRRIGSWFDLAVLLLALAVVFATLSVGSTVAIRWPSPARQRGLSMRGSTGWASMAVSIGMFVAGAALFGLLWLLRRAAGEAWRDPAGLLLGVLGLAAGVAIWWRSLELNARLVRECREKLVDAIARVAHDAT